MPDAGSGATPGPRVELLGVLPRALPLAIALTSFVVFLPALQGQFLNWDDDVNFLRNQGFRGLGWTHLKWMWSTPFMAHYIPLTWMTLGLNYALGGMNPWGYHLGNMLLHTANAVLFYFLARRLLAAACGTAGAPLLWGAAFAALVFAIHPLRVESVAWVTERRDVLCGFFSLITVLAHLRALESKGGAIHWRIASVAAFGAALLSKAQAVPLPAALLLLDAYPLRRSRLLGWGRLLAEKIPLFLFSGVGAVVVLMAVRRSATFTDYGQYGPASRLAMTAYGLVFYPRKWLWPRGLSPLYELPPRVDLLAPRFLVALIVLVTVTAVLIALRHRWPGGLAAWTYSAIMLLPVIGPVHAGLQLAPDRYSYLSGLGFAVLAGGALVWVLRAPARRLLGPGVVRLCAAVTVLALVSLAFGTWTQAGNWRNSETLWRWAVEIDPECAVCANHLGNALFANELGVTILSPVRAREAESAYRNALALRDLPAARANLGVALAVQGRSEEAEAELKTALRREPKLVAALLNLARLYAAQGRYDEAEPYYRRALASSPGDPEVRAGLGGTLLARGVQRARDGRFEGAVLLFTAALELQPDDAETLRLLGEGLLAQGRVAEAVAALRRAVALAPMIPLSRVWLVRAYRRSGDHERAEAEVAALRLLDPTTADHLAKTDGAQP